MFKQTYSSIIIYNDHPQLGYSGPKEPHPDPEPRVPFHKNDRRLNYLNCDKYKIERRTKIGPLTYFKHRCQGQC